jgi:hypothetical protein
MITDKELMIKIEDVTKEYSGLIDHLYEAVGMIVVGRLFGWRVMRLVSSRRCWSLASEIFGDPKELMPERGRYAHKSYGLRIVDAVGGYWDFIKGKRDAMLLQDRKRTV